MLGSTPRQVGRASRAYKTGGHRAVAPDPVPAPGYSTEMGISVV
jgi:hypothetical protein